MPPKNIKTAAKHSTTKKTAAAAVQYVDNTTFEKQYVIGENRILTIRKCGEDYTIYIGDTKTENGIEFSPQRWACFLLNIQDINDKVSDLREKKAVDYCLHIGAGWHVSVSTGVWCVDLRKFFVPYGQPNPKPTRRGIGLRLKEWETLKTVATQLQDDFPAVGLTQPCYLSIDHANLECYLQCPECSPFPNNPISIVE